MATLLAVSAHQCACRAPNQKRFGKAGKISVIIPIWRDGDGLIPLVQRLISFPEIREVIISAAEPSVNLRKRIEMLGAIFVQNAKPNRGLQLNKGAQIATADWLLFHHADAELRPEHIQALAELEQMDVIGGAFHRQFDERHPHLCFLEKFERWHSRAFGTLYGDQSIFVRRKHFARIGGFAAIPLMEDVDLSRKLRRSGKIKLLDPPVRSCARMQIAQGAWRVTLRNLLFLILFRCGVPAARLHTWYYSGERHSKHGSLIRLSPPVAKELR
jgi:GT2 family glycosyltransferase